MLERGRNQVWSEGENESEGGGTIPPMNPPKYAPDAWWVAVHKINIYLTLRLNIQIKRTMQNYKLQMKESYFHS